MCLVSLSSQPLLPYRAIDGFLCQVCICNVEQLNLAIVNDLASTLTVISWLVAYSISLSLFRSFVAMILF